MMNTIETLQYPIWQGGELRCAARREETHDSASFDLVTDTQQRFDFKPGQFVTIGIEVDGQCHYRAYSMSSSPSNSDALTITVRRLPGGLVSNYLLDHFQAGDSVRAMAIAGEFYLPSHEANGKLILLSAGSGVTPVMSMARWLLERDADAEIHFIYSARSDRDVIFLADLQAMQQRYRNFKLDLFLDHPEGQLQCHAGFLTPERLDALIADPMASRFYLCGNQPYMDMVEGWHCARGLAAEHFHKESFKPEDLLVLDEGGEVFQLSVPAFGTIASIRSGQPLLEIMEQNAVPIIGACRSGVCGSCKCKVIEGDVERLSTATLTPEELEQGFVLACSTRAKSDLSVELVF